MAHTCNPRIAGVTQRHPISKQQKTKKDKREGVWWIRGHTGSVLFFEPGVG